MRFPCRQFVGALVIILMALASVAPQGYSHSHEVAVCHEHDEAHGHAHPHGAAHSHQHAACHRHCHTTEAEKSQASMLAPHTHRHVFWWGVEFVLPPASSSDSGETPSEFEGPQLRSLASSSMEAVVAMTASPMVLPTLLLAQAAEAAPTPSHSALACAERPECNLLCDAARHERSGVQLL